MYTYKTTVLASLMPTIIVRIFTIAAILIGIVRWIVIEPVDPMDDSVNKSVQVFPKLVIYDKNAEGFRVHYATKMSVTDERFKEMRNRPNIVEAFYKIEKEGAAHFNNDLLHTDIYDFAEYVVGIEVDPALELHNIFVLYGAKSALYTQTNPKTGYSRNNIHSGTEQGNLYLSKMDIYNRRAKEDRIYRYWKCSFINDYSKTDEQFIHFTKEEELKW